MLQGVALRRQREAQPLFLSRDQAAPCRHQRQLYTWLSLLNVKNNKLCITDASWRVARGARHTGRQRRAARHGRQRAAARHARTAAAPQRLG